MPNWVSAAPKTRFAARWRIWPFAFPRQNGCIAQAIGGGLAAAARGIQPIATEIGMPLLGQVTRDVCACIESGDAIALGATLARLLRVGERSLYAVWDLQDLSI